MKISLKTAQLPYITLFLGVLGLIFMCWLQLGGIDDKGLFIPFHIAGILLWLATAAMAGCLALLWPKLGGRLKYKRLFPASVSAAAGTAAAGVCFLFAALGDLVASTGPLALIPALLGLAAAGCMLFLAWCRFRNRRGGFLPWTVVTAYAALQMLFQYRSWSAQPELMGYFFPLMASVCMSLALYQRTAFCVNAGSRRLYAVFSQAGAFFAMICLPGNFSLLYLGLFIWAMTDLCVLTPVKPRRPRYARQEEA